MYPIFKILAMICCFLPQEYQRYKKQGLSSELLKKIDQQIAVFNEEEMQQWLDRKSESERRRIKKHGISWAAGLLDERSGWKFADSCYVQAVRWLLAQGALIDQGAESTFAIRWLLHRLINNHDAFKIVFIDNAIMIPATILNHQDRRDWGYDGYFFWGRFSEPFWGNHNPPIPMTESSCLVLRYLLKNGLDIYTPAGSHFFGIYETILAKLRLNYFGDQISDQNQLIMKEIMEDFLVHQRQGNLEKLLHDRRLMDAIIRCDK